MPTTFLVDDATNTPFTSGSAGVQVVVGTATSINGSPIGALAGLVGNFALDTSTNTLWACTASGTSGSAQWEQVLTNPSLYALINGSSGQVFNVADATQDSEAINYGQAFQLLSGSPPASITLGNTLHTVAQFTLTASGSVTLEPGSVVGQEITIYGGAYALTVNSNVTSGSPYFLLPDESEVYSWTIPASGFAQGIRVDWDGTNWLASTFGQTVVAPATEDNQAPQLSQLFVGNRKAVFTSNGTWPVPDFVDTIWVSGCAGGAGGGGGGGGGDTNYNGSGGGGGGAGQSTIKQAISVTGGHTLSITIGAGGAGGTVSDQAAGGSGGDGGNTVLTDSTSSTTLLTLTGGTGGTGGIVGDAGNSAGGAGGTGYPSGGWGSDGCGTANNTTATALGGVGASSPFGGGGCPGRAGSAAGMSGTDAFGYGGGGGGGGGDYGGGTGSYPGGAGGNGAPGFLVIEW